MTELIIPIGKCILVIREQLRRNSERFPKEFIFQLNQEDKLKVAAKCGDLNKIHFSATILNSPKTIEMSIYIVKTFIKIKEAMLVNKQFAMKLCELESKVETHDDEIKTLFDTLRNLLEPVLPQKRKKIGLK